MENEMMEFSSKDESNITSKLLDNKNYKYINKSPLGMTNISKIIKKSQYKIRFIKHKKFQIIEII